MLKISAHEWFAGQNICPDIPDTGSVACISNVYGTCIIHHSHTSIRKRCLLSGFWGSSVVMTPPRSSRGSSRIPDSSVLEQRNGTQALEWSAGRWSVVGMHTFTYIQAGHHTLRWNFYCTGVLVPVLLLSFGRDGGFCRVVRARTSGAWCTTARAPSEATN